jgi:hypothetical protein
VTPEAPRRPLGFFRLVASDLRAKADWNYGRVGIPAHVVRTRQPDQSVPAEPADSLPASECRPSGRPTMPH